MLVSNNLDEFGKNRVFGKVHLYDVTVNPAKACTNVIITVFQF